MKYIALSLVYGTKGNYKLAWDQIRFVRASVTPHARDDSNYLLDELNAGRWLVMSGCSETCNEKAYVNIKSFTFNEPVPVACLAVAGLEGRLTSCLVYAKHNLLAEALFFGGTQNAYFGKRSSSSHGHPSFVLPLFVVRRRGT